MKNNLYEKLFNFDINSCKKISCSNNEIYNQLLLYIFSSHNGNLVILTPSLNDANKLYNELKLYVDNIYIFPEDDVLTKKAIASSPEFLYLRLSLINNISKNKKNIVICHVNSFLRKLPLPEQYSKKKLLINENDEIQRDSFIEKLEEIGYKRESIVTNSGEYSVRGFVLDIFPFFNENPVRIEFFDNIVEKIKEFDQNTQLSTNPLDRIEILPVKDEYQEMSGTLLDYISNPLTLFQDYSQLLNYEQRLQDQIKYFDGNTDLYEKLKNIKVQEYKQIDLIDNQKQYDVVLKSEEMQYFKDDIDLFYKDIKTNKGILFSTSKRINQYFSERDSEIKIIEMPLNNGFVYKGKHYYSENNLKHLRKDYTLTSNYKIGKKVNSLSNLKIGDYVVHRKSGIGVYSGITTITKNGIKKDYILIKYKGNDKLYLQVEDVVKLYKYASKEGSAPTIHRLNSKDWEKTKHKIRDRIKDISKELIELYKKRNSSKAVAFSADDEMQLMFESEFIYEETPDQIKTSEEIKRDLENSKPMDRLLCGDVGYGKTEVIFRAMFKAVINKTQVAYLCPTTLLSNQQYKVAVERFKNYGINIALINRHFTNKEIKSTIKKLKENKIDIVFGTHRLLSSDIEFNNLGLLVIDEEHRFGVEHKEKIKSLKENVHVLSVSATPIPRSLQMSLVGIRDLSLIETAPKNRYPVQTYVMSYDEYIIRELVIKEISREGQTFILYNNIDKMDKVVKKYKGLIPEARIAYAHGRMNKEEISDIMLDFSEGRYDVLLATTIIENGIDIPNANTMIVIDSDRFGLSQLYQIRGRVGRSDRIAYAYLMYDKSRVLTDTAIKRLEAIKEFTELGSGYKISMRDLSIRGAGDLLGKEQAGFIDSVGVDMYLDLINEELNNIEEPEEKNKISIYDVDTHIDEMYSDDDEIIIELHKMINNIETEKELKEIKSTIKDRFGFIDEKIENYINQEYLEKLLNKMDIGIIENTNLKITIKIKEKVYKQFEVEKMFINTLKISTKFVFQYKGNAIYVTLLKANLEKNYIKLMVDLLRVINKLIN